MRNKKVFISEFKRAFLNKGMLLSILISMGILIMYFSNYCKINLAEAYFPKESEAYVPYYIETAVNFWLLNTYSPYLYYLYYLLPFIAVLPFGMDYYMARKSGNLKNILIRQKRSDYAIRKYVITFVTGGCATAFISVVSYAFLVSFIPVCKTLPFMGNFYKPHWLEELYFTHTGIYIFIYICIYFLVGGILAGIALTVSTYIQNMLTVFLTPFLLMIVLLFIQERITIINHQNALLKYFPYSFMICGRACGGTEIILSALVFISIAIGALFVHRVKKAEIF